MNGIVSAIGEAAAEPRAGLEHADVRLAAGAGEVEGDRSATEAAADDGDGQTRVAHGREPARISPNGPVLTTRSEAPTAFLSGSFGNSSSATR